MFATQFDFMESAIFKHAKIFIVHVYANIYVLTPVEDCHSAMVRGLECLDDPMSCMG